MLLPFYVPNGAAPKVVVVGGGYAGLAALVTLREHCRSAEIALIDPQDHHLKITHLHESFRRPMAEFRLPFAMLERRFGIRHLQAALTPDEATLRRWNTDRLLVVGDEMLPFDYLLLANGAEYRGLAKNGQALDLADFGRQPGPELLDRHFGFAGREGRFITVVGGGPTGIQFLFEIAHFVRDRRLPCRLRLVDAGAAPLSEFNPKLGRYVMARMADLGIEHVSGQLFREQGPESVVVERRETGELSELPSALALLFAGKAPGDRLATNWFGQVTVGGEVLERTFAAGDCSRYRMPGSNALSAQTAVRKGKLAARNILRHSGALKVLEPYWHQDLGYVISMGPSDSVGWIGLEGNVVAGLPATVLKEVVEAQYDLLLAGVDTYFI